MALQRDIPYTCMNFRITCAWLGGDPNGLIAGLCEVIFPEACVHVIQYRNGNEPNNEPRKIQSFTYYGNLVLKRAAIGTLDWYSWWDAVREGREDVRSTVTVELLNEDHSSVVLTWKFLRARPVKHQFSPLNALCSDALIETLELAFERLEME